MKIYKVDSKKYKQKSYKRTKCREIAKMADGIILFLIISIYFKYHKIQLMSQISDKTLIESNLR